MGVLYGFLQQGFPLKGYWILVSGIREGYGLLGRCMGPKAYVMVTVQRF